MTWLYGHPGVSRNCWQLNVRLGQASSWCDLEWVRLGQVGSSCDLEWVRPGQVSSWRDLEGHPGKVLLVGSGHGRLVLGWGAY